MNDRDPEKHAGARVQQRATAAGWHQKLPPDSKEGQEGQRDRKDR